MTHTEFSNEQYSSAYPLGIERHYWSMARNAIIKDFLRQNKLEKKRMLEIGCGRGVVLRALRDDSFDCYGVELAPLTVPTGLTAYMHTGMSFEALDSELIDSIEAVLLFDVIEHIEDEKAFIKDILQTFPNLTHIVVTVPACPLLWSNYDTHYGHYRRYTYASLRAVMHEAGLATRSASYFFHALFIPARFLTFLKRERKTRLTVPEGLSGLFHKIVALYFFIEYKFVPARMTGTSIIGIFARTH